MQDNHEILQKITPLSKLLPSECDEDLVRIKSKINLLINIFNVGTISILIKVLISYLVTLEINNGIEKITIQEILIELKHRIDKLNSKFDELCFTINNLPQNDNTNEMIVIEKQKFRSYAYKLFDLCDILNILVKKCVTFGTGLHKILPMINKTYLEPLTFAMVNSLFFIETQDDFEKTLLLYINDRTDTISDPVKKKMTKITILNNLLNIIVAEPIDNKKINEEAYDNSNVPKTTNKFDEGMIPLLTRNIKLSGFEDKFI